MKCDELIAHKADVTIPVYGTIADAEVYLKEKADAAIAELKAVRKVHVEAIASMEAGLHQDGEEIRRLRRALWLARALRARDIQRWWLSVTLAPITERACRVWNNIEIKCLKKAEEYKCNRKN